MSDAAPDIVTFEPRADGFTAMLGVWPIGVILTTGGHAHRATWRLNLTGASPFWHYDHSVDAAKDRFTRKVWEWIDAAGLAPALPIDGVIRTTTIRGANGDGRTKRAESDRR